MIEGISPLTAGQALEQINREADLTENLPTANVLNAAKKTKQEFLAYFYEAVFSDLFNTSTSGGLFADENDQTGNNFSLANSLNSSIMAQQLAKQLARQQAASFDRLFNEREGR